MLVVDDDPDIREMLRLVLEAAGYLVYLAENGKETLELLAETEPLPSLILLDLMMPIRARAPRLLEQERGRETGVTAGPRRQTLSGRRGQPLAAGR